MHPSKGSWWPVLASSELGKQPAGRTRFGERFVFWRDGGRVVCMADQCPHRGAALSLGCVDAAAGTISCPFHGLAFAADGRCVKIPMEQGYAIPEGFGVRTLPAHEEDGYVWVWYGPLPDGELPAVPRHPDTLDMRYGESTSSWNAHYTRCIENVCDFSHLPYVHKTTIGRFKKDWVISVEIEDVPGGFRAQLFERGKPSQSIEFLYPNRWLLRLAPGIMQGLVFAPVDSEHTCVYGRTWHKLPVPGIRWLMDAYTRFSQFVIFRDDWPIVASQTPGDTLTATGEKLFPTDAPVIAYRKLHRQNWGQLS